jgi:hypothetical protein
MEKNGMLTEKSLSDFDKTKKAEWYDAEDYVVADELNKHKLKNPQKIADLKSKDNE